MIEMTRPTGGAPVRRAVDTPPLTQAGPARAPAAAPLAASASAEPPIDTDRVTTIRQALAASTYPLTPDTLAHSMIAARGLIAGDRP